MRTSTKSDGKGSIGVVSSLTNVTSIRALLRLLFKASVFNTHADRLTPDQAMAKLRDRLLSCPHRLEEQGVLLPVHSQGNKVGHVAQMYRKHQTTHVIFALAQRRSAYNRVFWLRSFRLFFDSLLLLFLSILHSLPLGLVSDGVYIGVVQACISSK